MTHFLIISSFDSLRRHHLMSSFHQKTPEAFVSHQRRVNTRDEFSASGANSSGPIKSFRRKISASHFPADFVSTGKKNVLLVS